ncbi:MAG: hypothetical protein AAF318_00220 [Pseudomonadota bacterium]
MIPTKATILPNLAARSDLAGPLSTIAQIQFYSEAKDFNRPPPLLASVYELLTGSAFAMEGGTGFQFLTADEAPAPGLLTVWMRIDTRYGDLASGTGRRIELFRRLDAMGPDILDRLAAGQGLLILDWSHEGRPTFWRSNIRRIVEAYAIPPQNVVVLTQNTAPPDPPVDDAPDVRIANAHDFIPQFWRLFFGKSVRRGEKVIPLGFALSAETQRKYRYTCMNFEATATRALIVSKLLDRQEKGLVSFRKDQFRRSMPGSQAFKDELTSVSQPSDQRQNHDRVGRFLAINRNYAIDLPPGTHPRYAAFFMPVDELKATDIQIVTEQEMGFPDQQRFTEKTLKAVMSGTPYVVFGNQGTIRVLRNAGLDVLDDIVDHSYDKFGDPSARMDAAWREVERLISEPEPVSVTHRERLMVALDHNRAIFEGPLFHRWIVDPVASLVNLHPAATPDLKAAAAAVTTCGHAHV